MSRIESVVKEKERGSVILFILILVVLVVAGYLAYSKLYLNRAAPTTSSSTSTQTPQEQYQNPFDNSSTASGYSNPFSDNQNPFDNLQ